MTYVLLVIFTLEYPPQIYNFGSERGCMDVQRTIIELYGEKNIKYIGCFKDHPTNW